MKTPPFALRGVARVIDLGVQIAILEAAGRCSQWLPERGLLPVSDGWMVWVDAIAGISSLVAYTAVAEWLGGATLGKFLCGMRVVPFDKPTEFISMRGAVIRGALFLIDGLFFGMMRSEHQRRIGDDLGNTWVVWKGDAPHLRGWSGWPVGMLAAFLVLIASYLLAS